VRVLDGTCSSQPSCLLVSDVFDATIQITGLTAPELRARLFERGQAWPWHRLIERSPLKIELLGDRRSDLVGGRSVAIERDLADGQVRLVSGGSSELRVRPNHDDRASLLPASLYLCFAQQWAQAGLIALHGAAFVSSAGGTLAIGGKGTGKSTLTTVALSVGCPVVSDDWVLAKATPDSLIVERLRRFIMLRRSWASQRLLAELPNLGFVQHQDRPKVLLRVRQNDHRFPKQAEISRIFVLSRPRGARTENTQLRPLSSNETMAAMIQFSMPLLFSAAMPIERARLLQSITLCLRRTQKLRVVPGASLIGDPAQDPLLRELIPPE